MPRFDGTGPTGEGPRTGMGRGDCANRKPCCKRNTNECRQEKMNREDYLEEKKVLLERLDEIEKELNK